VRPLRARLQLRGLGRRTGAFAIFILGFLVLGAALLSSSGWSRRWVHWWLWGLLTPLVVSAAAPAQGDLIAQTVQTQGAEGRLTSK
jgi:uncharacterized protein (DUF983 family)